MTTDPSTTGPSSTGPGAPPEPDAVVAAFHRALEAETLARTGDAARPPLPAVRRRAGRLRGRRIAGLASAAVVAVVAVVGAAGWLAGGPGPLSGLGLPAAHRTERSTPPADTFLRPEDLGPPGQWSIGTDGDDARAVDEVTLPGCVSRPLHGTERAAPMTFPARGTVRTYRATAQGTGQEWVVAETVVHLSAGAAATAAQRLRLYAGSGGLEGCGTTEVGEFRAGTATTVLFTTEWMNDATLRGAQAYALVDRTLVHLETYAGSSADLPVPGQGTWVDAAITVAVRRATGVQSSGLAALAGVVVDQPRSTTTTPVPPDAARYLPGFLTLYDLNTLGPTVPWSVSSVRPDRVTGSATVELPACPGEQARVVRGTGATQIYRGGTGPDRWTASQTWIRVDGRTLSAVRALLAAGAQCRSLRTSFGDAAVEGGRLDDLVTARERGADRVDVMQGWALAGPYLLQLDVVPVATASIPRPLVGQRFAALVARAGYRHGFVPT